MSVVTSLPEAIGGELTGNPTVRKITLPLDSRGQVVDGAIR